MKTFLLPLLLLLATVATAADVQVDDTYDQVIAAKGAPAGQMKTSSSQVLQYPDATIKLVGGRVTSITAPAPKRTPTPQVASAPAKETAPAVPECSYAAAGFEAKLPGVVTWKLTSQMDGSDTKPYVRQFDSGDREIVIAIGPDPHPGTEHNEFLAAWKQGFIKPGLKIVAEDSRVIDGVRLSVIDAQFKMAGGGVRQIRCLVGKANSFVYILSARSDTQRVAEDNVLMAFLNSIRIKAPKS